MPSIIEVDTIKNKTGTQNTVLSTDGSGNNTLNAGVIKSNNIKHSNGTNALVIDSGGQVQFQQVNPNITLGNNTTFPTGIIESQTVYKYSFSTNTSYGHGDATRTIATRKTSSDTSVEDISVVGGYTYVYQYNGYLQVKDGNTHWRAAELTLFDDDTTKSQGGTNENGLKQAFTLGREAYNNSSADMSSFCPFEISCASYYSSNDTRYIYLCTSNISSATLTTIYFTADTPLYLKITKIKGNVITSRT